MSLSVEPNTRKETRNSQLPQFDPAIPMMLLNGVYMLPTLNVELIYVPYQTKVG